MSVFAFAKSMFSCMFLRNKEAILELSSNTFLIFSDCDGNCGLMHSTGFLSPNALVGVVEGGGRIAFLS